jgi:integrase
VLTDDELRAVWRAAGEYPFGAFVKMLILTGQRRGEVAGMRWSEVNGDLWTLPPERMKGDAAHEVPLSGMAVELLESLPHVGGGDYVFSTTAGQRPISGFSKNKRRLRAGNGWTLHDLRRTVRTRLSGLGVPDLISELIIAHRRPELHAIYDLHTYREEKREALEKWAARLLSIVEPPPDNVVPLKERANAS